MAFARQFKWFPKETYRELIWFSIQFLSFHVKNHSNPRWEIIPPPEAPWQFWRSTPIAFQRFGKSWSPNRRLPETL